MNYKENMFTFEVSTWYEHRIVVARPEVVPCCIVAFAPCRSGNRRNRDIDTWVFLIALVIWPSPFIS
jgi:hypothetical protein